MPDFLEVRDLTFSISGHKILDEISFGADRGECLCIIGPNGAGKSTLLKCIGGLHKNFSGAVSLEGRPLLSMKNKSIARRIAWVHQTGSDSLPFTVREFAKMS
ncbi:MAG: ABC transporter ATP-binding protein, partial [Synergistaceae bacterium]|nr:ABC transporter ATP-binding protein [Synergistaceae bacterium]